MRPTFTEEQRIKARAKRARDDGTAQVRRWWSKKYNLPPNHVLFENRTMADLQQEMFEDLMARCDEIRTEIESSGDPKGHLLNELNDLLEALGEEDEVQDDLFDEWERAIERGEVPDLDKMPG